MTNEERHIAVLNRMLESMDVYDSIQPTTERKKAIKAAIKALEQTTWITVSERLPEKDGQYLVTVKNLTGYEQLCNDVFECEFFGKDWIFKGWKDNRVIAWMPLPPSYQGEENG